jgi:hypothetical protein
MNSEFHLKITPWVEEDKWEIHFTNNNWNTEDHIRKHLKLNDFGGYAILDFLFSKQEALDITGKLYSYEDCIEFNRINEDAKNLEKLKNKKLRLDTEIIIR